MWYDKSMIFTFDGSDYGLDKIFHNRNIEIEEWTSKIPGMDFFKATAYDDELMKMFQKSDLYNGMSYIADRYIYNVVTTARILVGNLAASIGFLQTDFINISNAFKESPGDMALKVINGVDAIINSEMFQKGMNALGAIPIVGWILKIIVKVAEMIYKIYDAIVKKKIQQSDFELLNQPWVPIWQFTKEADEELTKYTIDHINSNNIQWCFTPRNYWEDLQDFVVVREKRGEKEKLTDFYQLRSNRDSVSGAGFIPGTTFLSSHIRFITKAGIVRGFPNVMDTGIFYPTVQSVCNQLYQVIQKIGPALYGVDCDYLTTLWEDNIASLLEYEKQSIRYGWTQYPTSCVKEMDDSDCKTEDPYFQCDEAIYASNYDNPYNIYNDGCRKKSQSGNKVKFGTKNFNSASAFRQYLADTYFGGTFKDKNGNSIRPTISADDTKIIDPAQSVPSKALKVLKDRQWAAINSLTCAYIADDNRFPAVKDALKDKRAKNLGILLNSSDWKRLYWRDIVDQDLRSAVAEKASKAKLTYDKEGPIVKPSLAIAVPSVLGDPTPPKPFDPIKDSGRYGIGSKPSVVSKSSSSSLPLTIGAAGLAYFFLKR